MATYPSLENRVKAGWRSVLYLSKTTSVQQALSLGSHVSVQSWPVISNKPLGVLKCKFTSKTKGLVLSCVCLPIVGIEPMTLCK